MAPSVLLRVRLPSGATSRIPVSQGTSQSSLEASIGSLASLPGPAQLFKDPSFKHPFALNGASHGDLVFVKRDFTPVTEPGTSIDTSTVPASTTTEKAEEKPWRGRCRHGPRGMCENCMPSEDATERYKAEISRWKGRGMSVAVMEAREALKPKVKPQESAHATAACIDASAAQEFQAYLGMTGFSQQRFGVCYGVVDDVLETQVHAIYEPPQNGDASAYSIQLLPLPGAVADGSDGGEQCTGSRKADMLASVLGLRCVGIVFSARDRRAVLSGRDVVIAARYASTLGEEERKLFVILKVAAVADTGETSFEAYQISDLAHELYANGVFAAESEQKANSGKVLCSREVLVEGKDTKRVHTEFFLNNVPIKTINSWLRVDFPVANRDVRPQKGSDLASAVAKTNMPYWKRISDFHLLLYLTGTFSIDTDIPALVACIKEQKDVEEGYKLMIQSIAATS